MKPSLPEFRAMMASLYMAERGAVADLYDDLESQAPPDRSRLERFLLFAFAVMLAYTLSPISRCRRCGPTTNTRRASPICRW